MFLLYKEKADREITDLVNKVKNLTATVNEQKKEIDQLKSESQQLQEMRMSIDALGKSNATELQSTERGRTDRNNSIENHSHISSRTNDEATDLEKSLEECHVVQQIQETDLVPIPDQPNDGLPISSGTLQQQSQSVNSLQEKSIQSQGKLLLPMTKFRVLGVSALRRQQ
jgi:chromosome segregation ATPase